MTIRAAIYARVSTDEQADRGYSLPSQVNACQTYANANGMYIVDIFQDDFSGARLDRPELTKLRDRVRMKEIDAIVVYSIDRLTRNMAHLLILRDEFDKAGVERHIAMRGKAADNAETRMLENIEGVFAEYEREKIKERVTRGRYTKARSGKHVGNGKAPYGYHHDREHSQLVIYEPEAEIVRLIYRLYLHGDEDGDRMSIYQITRYLADQQIVSPSESAGTRHVRASKHWSEFAVRCMLVSETYCGTARYGRAIGRGGSEGYRPLSETVPIAVPPIVSRAEWEQVQERMKENSRYSRRNSKYQYLLRGMIKCGLCDAAMVGGSIPDRSKTFVRRYYRCNRMRHAYGTKQKCTFKWQPLAAVEDGVWDTFLKMFTKDAFEAALLQAQKDELDAVEPKRADLARVNRLISECKSQMDDYLEMRRAVMHKLHKDELPKNNLMIESIDHQIGECNARYNALQSEKVKLDATLSQATLSDEMVANLLKFREQIAIGLDQPTFDDKRYALEALKAEVKIFEGYGELTLRVSSHKAVFEIGTLQTPAPPCAAHLPAIRKN